VQASWKLQNARRVAPVGWWLFEWQAFRAGCACKSKTMDLQCFCSRSGRGMRLFPLWVCGHIMPVSGTSCRQAPTPGQHQVAGCHYYNDSRLQSGCADKIDCMGHDEMLEVCSKTPWRLRVGLRHSTPHGSAVLCCAR